MSNFTIGDQIIVTEDFRFDEVKFREGQTGTIIDIRLGEDRYEGGTMSIQWDFENRNFHSCQGLCPLGTGYNVTLNRAKVIRQQSPNSNPLPDDPRLRGICIKIKQMEQRFKLKQLQKLKLQMEKTMYDF